MTTCISLTKKALCKSASWNSFFGNHLHLVSFNQNPSTGGCPSRWDLFSSYLESTLGNLGLDLLLSSWNGQNRGFQHYWGRLFHYPFILKTKFGKVPSWNSLLSSHLNLASFNQKQMTGGLPRRWDLVSSCLDLVHTYS